MKRLFSKAPEDKESLDKKSLNQERIPKKIVLTGLAVCLVIVGGLGFYFSNNNKQPSSNAPLTVQESAKVIEAVGKLIELPAGEEPILATVTDVALLPKDPFYDKAKNGDRVLVYKGSKMAILYRPGPNKIIKVGSVKIEESRTATGSGGAVAGVSNTNTSPTPEKSVTPTPGVLRVAIYNGTKTSGLAKKTGDSLEAKFQNIEVVSTANATGDHTKTLVVDLSADKAGLSGKNKNAASSLSKELGGEVGSLPEAETAPSGADILIILGQAQ